MRSGPLPTRFVWLALAGAATLLLQGLLPIVHGTAHGAAPVGGEACHAQDGRAGDHAPEDRAPDEHDCAVCLALTLARVATPEAGSASAVPLATRSIALVSFSDNAPRPARRTGSLGARAPPRA